MTTLQREVQRAASGYVVALRPARGDQPARVALREKGRRTWYEIPVGRLYVRLVDLEVAGRRRSRRASRI